MPYNPSYSLRSGENPIKTDPVSVTIEGKVIPGYLTTFSKGTSKWTSAEVVNNTGALLTINADYSTFTGKKDDDGNWIWEATTSSSIPNLSRETSITEQKIEQTLNSNSFQNPLNGIRVNQLGGIEEAAKIDPSIPATGGSSIDENADPGSTSAQSVNDSPATSTANVLSRERNKPDPVIGAEGASYPSQLGSMDRIRFRALKIDKKQYSSQFNDGKVVGEFLSAFEPSENNYEVVDGPVYIGIQAPISDQNNVGWGNGNLNALEAYMYKKALGLIGNNSDIPGELDRIGGEILAISDTSNEEIKRLVAGMAAGMNDILPRVSAQILNPNLELLFQGPQLRPFNFTFNLIAYDVDESTQIKKIIKFFKQNMAVQKTDNYLFLHAPNVFEIRYMSESADLDHQSINLITGDSETTKKACALTNCSVDYTPLGSYMTFQDTERSMVQYTLNLQFQELTPVYDEDYKSSNSIGY